MTLCIIRNLARGSSITGGSSIAGSLGNETVKLKLTFAKAVKGLKNERTGKALGDGKVFEDAFTPYEANVYTYTP